VGACRQWLWTYLVVVWSYNFVEKEVICMEVTSFLKFGQGACVLAVG
jgi:hypothetical protein